jgi:hypothetical protein
MFSRVDGRLTPREEWRCALGTYERAGVGYFNYQEKQQ